MIKNPIIQIIISKVLETIAEELLWSEDTIRKNKLLESAHRLFKEARKR